VTTTARQRGDLRRGERAAFALSRWIESYRHPRHRYAIAIGIVAAATAISAALFPLGDTENLVMVYLLGVVLAAIRLGRGPSLLATLLGLACFVYFFVPHYNSFVLADLYYLPTFAIMVTVAFIVSALTSKVRADAVAMEERERQSRALYELSRDLAAAESREDVAIVVQRHVAPAFSCDASIVESDGEVLRPFLSTDPAVAGDAGTAMQQAIAGRRAVDCGGFVAQPLIVAGEAVGLMCCAGLDLQLLRTDSTLRLLESFANNVAVAMHRILVGEHAMQARQKVEEERLRNVMLSSVSHDLRTPLASITGAASTLIDSDSALDAATRLDLMHSIREDADSLERQVRNMLDFKRIEAGGLRPQRDWHSIEEVVGCAMRRVETLLAGRPVSIRIADAMPLVWIDGALLEQLLVNLLENAAKHTPPGVSVDLDARMNAGVLSLSVADRGPGVATEERERVFLKFHRGPGAQPLGSGLGLAICRAIALLHDGSIHAESRDGGGAAFVLRLPVKTQSPPRDLERGEGGLR
jgi:two-component system sensor histidine kinase KdpD